MNDKSVLGGIIKLDEVVKYIPSMFPLSDGKDGYEILPLGSDDFIAGSCDGEIIKRSVTIDGVIEDLPFKKFQIDNIEKALVLREELLRAKGLSEQNPSDELKVVVIVNKEYMVFSENTFQSILSGFVLSSEVRDEKTNTPKKKYYDVQFTIKERLEKGAISHELAHQFGQGIEFYQKKDIYDDEGNLIKGTYCRAFADRLLSTQNSVCRSYKIPKNLSTIDGFSLLLHDKFTIMDIKSNLKEKWIDRDTYRKAFRYLSSPITTDAGSALVIELKKEILPLKAVRVSLIDSSGNAILQKKFPTNMFIKTIPSESGGASQIIRLPEVPIVGSFSIPEGRDPKTLRIKFEGLVDEELEDENTSEEGVYLGSTRIKEDYGFN